jgi:integrase
LQPQAVKSNERTIAALPKLGKRYRVKVESVNGLYVDVQASGTNAYQLRSMLARTAGAIWGAWGSPRMVADLKRADLREAIEDVAAKVSRYQAVLVRAIVSATYNWAQDRELIEASPAQHKDRRKGQGSHSRLYRGRTAPILACARRRPLRVDGRVTALKLLILTGKRLAEVVIAKKADVHLGGFDPYWFLPDTKNGQADDVPFNRDDTCAVRTSHGRSRQQ